MYLLDTDVVSELRKEAAGRADPQVVRWVAAVPRTQLFVSAVTMFELELGVLRSERADPVKGERLRRWLEDDVVPSFARQVFAVNDRVARLAAAFHVPDPAPLRDSLIGATALVHRMPVVTGNDRDFTRFEGLGVVNPWR
jgi:predicted nucleic acid-binding protein